MVAGCCLMFAVCCVLPVGSSVVCRLLFAGWCVLYVVCWLLFVWRLMFAG